MRRWTLLRALPRLRAAAWASAAGATALPAAASPSTQRTFIVSGRVAPACSLAASAPPLTITTTVDNNGKLDAGLEGKTFVLPGLYCSSPSTITVSATALRLTTPRASVPNGQSQTANFTAAATGWSPTAATVTTGETAPIGTTRSFAGTAQRQPVAKQGPITVTVRNFTPVTGSNGNGWKLVNGAYGATITISLSPAS